MKTRRIFLFLFLALFFIGVVVSPRLEASDVDTLIKQAFNRGEIDSETALVYRVLKVVAPERLPDSFKADKVRFEKCATLIMLELSARWPGLSAGSRKRLEPYLLRNSRLIPKAPDRRDKGVFQSSLPNSCQTTNFNIEWGNTIPTITEWQDNDSNGRPDYIDNLAVYLETCWAHEVETLQLLEPDQSSTYYVNVYVANTGDGAPTLGSNIYGYTTTFPYDTGLSGPLDMAYIVMNDDYSAFPANDDPEGKFKGAMKVTFAHEFFHVIQFTYDIDEAGWFMELSATWMEDEIFTDVNDYYNYLQGSGGW